MLDIHVSFPYSPLIENQDLSNELQFWNIKPRLCISHRHED